MQFSSPSHYIVPNLVKIRDSESLEIGNKGINEDIRDIRREILHIFNRAKL